MQKHRHYCSERQEEQQRRCCRQMVSSEFVLQLLQPLVAVWSNYQPKKNNNLLLQASTKVTQKNPYAQINC
jgi:hypothetical protein